MSADPDAVAATAPILEVKGLAIRFKLPQGWVTAVDGVDFELRRGEVVGIVGESGSGKSQILLALMGLLAANGRASGSALFQGREILNRSARELDEVRGSAMAMIFQDPMTSLNPYMRVSDQLTEVLTTHRGVGSAEALEIAVRMLERVRIPEARRRIRLYPHEFSGGMRQRVMIAMALLCEPALLFADEPTTALDVTVQAQILELLADLARDFNAAVAIVTHDLGVIARLCDRVIVLYGGRIMEQAPIEEVFYDPRHPYTKGLLASMPRLDESPHEDLRTIPGQPRAAMGDLPGCPFAPRCEQRIARCTQETPLLLRAGDGRAAACHLVAP
ncbi:MAG TPA: oligopeptide/dipeptide ABC transporter ATP-binding protein [Candidatus Acidoferrum sp.]|nr:oligopeptide/dipeptide ABC transporter ATP-binding protein [Candidatus Acidoferrum sp.]